LRHNGWIAIKRACGYHDGIPLWYEASNRAAALAAKLAGEPFSLRDLIALNEIFTTGKYQLRIF
jgi:hypothetical protein